MSNNYDSRITPARHDLAAESLRGVVTAKRYVSGITYRVSVFVADLVAKPETGQTLQSQLLFGEQFICYEAKDGWAWGQASRDGYVGYVQLSALSIEELKPDHWVSALRTTVFQHADLKSPILGFLHRNSQVNVTGSEDQYRQIALGWVYEGDLRPLKTPSQDWVEVALTYLHAPYVWGGRSSFGLDCSALIQNALQAAAINCPRDSDMQADQLGKVIELSNLMRGDLLFWQGHVGMMLDAENFLHANAFHMKTAIEPLNEAASRIQKTAGPIKLARRLM